MNAYDLQSDRVYSVAELQGVLGISAVEILDAIRRGEIARHLGAGMNAAVLGIDLVDWLNIRPIDLSERR